MRIPGLLVSLWLLAGSGSTVADIYRCQGEQGEALFSERPCASQSIVSIPGPDGEAAPPAGLRASERAWLAKRSATRTQRTRGSKATVAAPARAADKPAFQCRRKRSELDAVKAELRRGYKPAKGEKLRRRRDAYEDYLAAFCS